MKKLILLAILSACASSFDDTSVKDDDDYVGTRLDDGPDLRGQPLVGFAIAADGLNDPSISDYYFGVRFNSGLEIGSAFLYYYQSDPHLRVTAFGPRISYFHDLGFQHVTIGHSIERVIVLQGSADYTESYLLAVKLNYDPIELMFGYIFHDQAGMHTQQFGIGALELRFKL